MSRINVSSFTQISRIQSSRYMLFLNKEVLTGRCPTCTFFKDTMNWHQSCAYPLRCVLRAVPWGCCLWSRYCRAAGIFKWPCPLSFCFLFRLPAHDRSTMRGNSAPRCRSSPVNYKTLDSWLEGSRAHDKLTTAFLFIKYQISKQWHQTDQNNKHSLKQTTLQF